MSARSLLRAIGITLILGLLPIVPTGFGGQATIPWGVHLSTQSDPSGEVTVTWFTDSEVPSIVMYGPSDRFGIVAQGKTFTYPRVPWYIHEVKIEGLESGKRYHYNAGSPEGGWSSTYSFVTASKNQPFRFIAWADQQSLRRIAHLAISRAKELSVPLLIHAGDITSNDADWSLSTWRAWFKMAEPLTAQTIYMPSIGNHEYEPPEFITDKFPYLGLFSLPRDERSYSFMWGNTYFLSIEIAEPYRQATAEEVRWIESDLSRAEQANVKWKVVYFHTPFYVSGNYTNSDDYRRHVKPFRDRIEPLLERYNVDLAITGHDHIYERTYPVYQNRVWRSPDVSRLENPPYPVYVVTGGAGDYSTALGDLKPEWSLKKESVPHFLIVDVTKYYLNVKSVRIADNSVLDEFRIVKGGGDVWYAAITMADEFLCRAKQSIGRDCSEHIWDKELDIGEWPRLADGAFLSLIVLGGLMCLYGISVFRLKQDRGKGGIGR